MKKRLKFPTIIIQVMEFMPGPIIGIVLLLLLLGIWELGKFVHFERKVAYIDTRIISGRLEKEPLDKQTYIRMYLLDLTGKKDTTRFTGFMEKFHTCKLKVEEEQYVNLVFLNYTPEGLPNYTLEMIDCLEDNDFSRLWKPKSRPAPKNQE